MWYQIIIAAGLVIFLLNLVLNLRSLKKPRLESQMPAPAPFVSVLIPARNEEQNIEACLNSLQAQDYPAFEVLVLDDSSTDKTAEIVTRLADQDKRIQLIKGGPLPEDWAGKPYACYQLAMKARGDWLLFVDADTTHEPYMLRSIMALALQLKPSLLSGFPRQLATSLSQKIAIPILYFVILSWLPLWWLQREKVGKPSLAVGQFLLFPKEAYWRIGGHQAVKSRIMEDVWLGMEINKQGGRQVAVDLSPVVSCQMYRSLGTMWEGFVKWIYSVAALSRLALVGLLAAAYIFFLAPFYWLVRGLWAAANPSGWPSLIIFQVAALLVMRRLKDQRFKEPLVSTLTHPFGFIFLFLAGLYGGIRQAAGAGVRWKKRLYGMQSAVK